MIPLDGKKPKEKEVSFVVHYVQFLQ